MRNVRNVRMWRCGDVRMWECEKFGNLGMWIPIAIGSGNEKKRFIALIKRFLTGKITGRMRKKTV